MYECSSPGLLGLLLSGRSQHSAPAAPRSPSGSSKKLGDCTSMPYISNSAESPQFILAQQYPETQPFLRLQNRPSQINKELVIPSTSLSSWLLCVLCIQVHKHWHKHAGPCRNLTEWLKGSVPLQTHRGSLVESPRLNGCSGSHQKPLSL